MAKLPPFHKFSVFAMICYSSIHCKGMSTIAKSFCLVPIIFRNQLVIQKKLKQSAYINQQADATMP